MIWSLWLCVLWIPLLMAGLLCNETKFKKNLAIGVTFPLPARQDPALLALLGQFRRAQWALAVGLVAVGLLAAVGVKDPGANGSLWGLWLLGACVLPQILYGIWNGKLKRKKAAWGLCAGSGTTVTVDTAVIPEAPSLPLPGFLLALAVSLLPLLWERTFALVYLMDAALVLLGMLSARFLSRRRSERVDGDRERTAVLTALRRRNWNRMWLLACWFMAGISLSFGLLGAHPLGLTAAVVVLGLAMTAGEAALELQTRKEQERLTAASGENRYVDEDDLWLWGIFYHNPRDSHLLVNQRVGANVTFNLARPAGKVLLGLLAALLLSLPFLVPLGTMEGPEALEVSLTEDTVTVTGGGSDYRLERRGLRAETLDTLPPGLIRIMGTGMPQLLRGQFYAPELGRLEVCLDPTAPPFLLLRDGSGGTLLVGSREPGAIPALLEELSLD